MGKHDLSGKDYEYVVLCTTAMNLKLRLLSSKSDFFKNEIKVVYHDDHVIFRLAGLDDKRPLKAAKDVHGWYHLSIKCQYDSGKYYFDKEDSTEDQKIIYFS